LPDASQLNCDRKRHWTWKEPAGDGQVNGNSIELWFETGDVRQKWTIHINGDRTPGGAFAGSYTISDGQYGVFSVVKE
jgi:hypothetical protein